MKLSEHPLLNGVTPGTDTYTLALRTLLLELNDQRLTPTRSEPSWQQVVEHARLTREWEALETAHVRLLPPLQRHRHLLILTPQVKVGDLDVLCYPVGLGSMFLLSALLLNLNFGQSAIALACLSGMLLMLALDRYTTFARNRALRSFGLPDEVVLEKK